MWVTKLACNSTPCVSNQLPSRWPRLQPVISFGRCRRLLACFSDPFLVFDGSFPWSTKLLYNLRLRGECVLFGGGGGVGMPSLGMSHDCSGNGVGFSKTSSQPRRACPWGMSRYVLSGFPFVWGPLSSSEGGTSGAVSSEQWGSGSSQSFQHLTGDPRMLTSLPRFNWSVLHNRSE